MSSELAKELWYHGRISRTDAENILRKKGLIGGSFLLRDSLNVTGEYILSLCHTVSEYCKCVFLMIGDRQDKLIGCQFFARWLADSNQVEITCQFHLMVANNSTPV